MRKIRKMILLVLAAALVLSLCCMPAFAADEAETAVKAGLGLDSVKAIAACVAIAVVAGLGALAMSKAIGKSAESMARQPEASGKIQTAMMLGLVFIETAIIYALIVAILIIFVL